MTDRKHTQPKTVNGVCSWCGGTFKLTSKGLDCHGNPSAIVDSLLDLPTPPPYEEAP